MKRAFGYIKSNKRALLFLYWPIHMIWYQLVRIFADKMPNYFEIYSPLDEYIPFLEGFVLPYSVWYFYIFYVLLYFYFKNTRDYFFTSVFIIGCMFFPMLIATFLPNGIPQTLRPDFAALGRNNILIEGVKLVYASDSPPRSVMPSMHTSVSVALAVSVFTSRSLKSKNLIKIASLTLSTLICLSTVFIKQHSILDVFAGILIVVPVYVGARFLMDFIEKIAAKRKSRTE